MTDIRKAGRTRIYPPVTVVCGFRDVGDEIVEKQRVERERSETGRPEFVKCGTIGEVRGSRLQDLRGLSHDAWPSFAFHDTHCLLPSLSFRDTTTGDG